jgi:threonine dehydrogenase-like Zn-dependent dehydrogenase
VGLLTIACARLLGAEQIFVIDHHPYRLRFAEARYGAIPSTSMMTTTRRKKSSSRPRASAALTP